MPTIIVRANGELPTPSSTVDDSLMEITHVLRGEDLLPSTPRQIVLYDALKQIGVGSGRTPAFGHLPTVLGEGNRRLSKRDKGSGLAEYQQKGYLPEGSELPGPACQGIAEDRDAYHRRDG
jgi:glutamyl-tRNA synthetase